MDIIKPIIKCYSLRHVIVKVLKEFCSVYNEESVEIKNIYKTINDILNEEIINNMKEVENIDFMLFSKSIIDIFIDINKNSQSLSSHYFLNIILQLTISSKTDIRLYSIKKMKKIYKNVELDNIIASELILPILNSINNEEYHIIPHKFHLLNRIIANTPKTSLSIKIIKESIKSIKSYITLLMKMSNNNNSTKIIRRFLEFVSSILSYSNDYRNEIELINSLSVIMLNNINDSVSVRYSISVLLRIVIPTNLYDNFFKTYLRLTLTLIDDDNELIRDNINRSLILFLNQQSGKKNILFNPNNIEELVYGYLSSLKTDYEVMKLVLDPLYKEWKDLSSNNNSYVVYDKDEDTFYSEKYYKFKNIINCYNCWKKDEIDIVKETKKNATEYTKNIKTTSNSIASYFSKLVLDDNY